MTIERAQNLVLVEREGHVEHALQLFRKDPGSVVLIALAPAVMQAFTDAGVPYRTPENYVDAAALNQRGLDNYDLLEKLGQWIDDLASSQNFLKPNPIYLNFYRIKLLIDSVGLRVEEIAAILRAENPFEVTVLAYAHDPLWASPRDEQFMTLEGPIYACISPFVAQALGIKSRIQIVPGRWAGADHGLASRLRSNIGSVGKLIRMLAARLKSIKRKPVVWQIGEIAHDVPEILSTLESKFDIERWENIWHGPLGHLMAAALMLLRNKSLDILSLEKFWEETAREISEQALFMYAGINIFSFVSPVLKHVFVGQQYKAVMLFEAMRRFIRRKPPKAALTMNSPLYANTLAVLALRAQGVPVVYVQEGGLYGYCHCATYHYCELSYGNHIIAYGRGSADYLNATRPTPRQQAEAVPIAALRVRHLKGSRLNTPSPAKPIKTVLYAATLFHHNVRYAPMCYGEREYFELRRRALDSVLSVSGIKIIYKAVPGSLNDDSLLSYLARHQDRIERCDQPLTRVLERADLFVLDWPTTSLLELLTTAKPVCVLMDKNVTRPIDAALPLLRKRARVFLDLEAFEKGLRKVAEPSNEDLTDTSFLEAYGAGDLAIQPDKTLIDFFKHL